MGLMFQPFMKYVDFQGRARRSEYWLWALFLFVANAVLTAIQFAVMGGSAASMSAAHAGDAQDMHLLGGALIIGLVKLVFALAIILPSIAVSVRRMHDSNRTGWWIVFPTAVMLIAFVVVLSTKGADMMTTLKSLQGLSNSGNPAAIFATVAAAFAPLIWVILPTCLAKLVTLVFRVLDGTPGPNRFGPDPKGRRGRADVF